MCVTMIGFSVCVNDTVHFLQYIYMLVFKCCLWWALVRHVTFLSSLTGGYQCMTKVQNRFYGFLLQCSQVSSSGHWGHSWCFWLFTAAYECSDVIFKSVFFKRHTARHITACQGWPWWGLGWIYLPPDWTHSSIDSQIHPWRNTLYSYYTLKNKGYWL